MGSLKGQMKAKPRCIQIHSFIPLLSTFLSHTLYTTDMKGNQKASTGEQPTVPSGHLPLIIAFPSWWSPGGLLLFAILWEEEGDSRYKVKLLLQNYNLYIVVGDLHKRH